MIALIIAIIFHNPLSFFINNSIIKSVVILVIYYLAMFIANVMIKKQGKMTVVINLIERALSNLVQCVNTTKKVEDKDILLAYFSARKWIVLVYPEFFNKNEDVFLDNYFKS